MAFIDKMCAKMFVCYVSLISATLVLCQCSPFLKVDSQVPIRAATPDYQEDQGMRKLRKPEGYSIPCEDRLKVTKRTKLDVESMADIFAIKYEVAGCKDDDGGVYELFGGGKYERRVFSMVGYEVNGFVFEYTV